MVKILIIGFIAGGFAGCALGCGILYYFLFGERSAAATDSKRERSSDEKFGQEQAAPQENEQLASGGRIRDRIKSKEQELHPRCPRCQTEMTRDQGECAGCGLSYIEAQENKVIIDQYLASACIKQYDGMLREAKEMQIQNFNKKTIKKEPPCLMYRSREISQK